MATRPTSTVERLVPAKPVGEVIVELENFEHTAVILAHLMDTAWREFGSDLAPPRVHITIENRPPSAAQPAALAHVDAILQRELQATRNRIGELRRCTVSETTKRKALPLCGQARLAEETT